MPDFQQWGQTAQNMVMNPLTQGGLGLLSGGGFQGMQQGLLGGQKMQQTQHDVMVQKAKDDYIRSLDPASMPGVSPAFISAVKGTMNPDLLAKGLLGRADLEQELRKIAATGDIQSRLKMIDLQNALNLKRQGLQDDITLMERYYPGTLPTPEQPAPPQAAPAQPLSDGRYKFAPGQGVK